MQSTSSTNQKNYRENDFFKSVIVMWCIENWDKDDS